MYVYNQHNIKKNNTNFKKNHKIALLNIEMHKFYVSRKIKNVFPFQGSTECFIYIKLHLIKSLKG